MLMQTRLKQLCIFFVIVNMAACSVLPGGSNSTGSSATNNSTDRYDMSIDSGELEPIDISAIRSVVPVVEQRTAAGNKNPYTVNDVTYYLMESEEGYVQTGIASWYGRKFHGHLTANGEVYDMFALTAAHKSMPIPSYLKVTNLDNGKAVVVRVNDRGPFHENRIVDLSYAAAVMLDFADKGTAQVQIEALLPGETGMAPYASIDATSTPNLIDLTPANIPQSGIGSNAAGASTVAPGISATVVNQTPLRVEGLTGAPIEDRTLPDSVEEVMTLNPIENVSVVETLAPVNEVRIATPAPAVAPNQEYLQVGAFSNLASAQALLTKLTNVSPLPVFIRSEQATGAAQVLHRVRTGPIDESMSTADIIQLIRDAGLGTAFRVKQ